MIISIEMQNAIFEMLSSILNTYISTKAPTNNRHNLKSQNDLDLEEKNDAYSIKKVISGLTTVDTYLDQIEKL